MRFAVLLFLASTLMASQTQPDVWKQVNPNYNGPRLQQAQLSQAQKRAIGRLALQCCAGGFEAPEDTVKDLTQCLNFEEIPLAPKKIVLLINQENTGCIQPGSGGGGAMMLVRLEGDRPVLLASPENDFNGWLYSIQPSMSHGYHDLVLGWHMSAGEADLTYFQYNGKSYQSISRAASIVGEDGKYRIDPNIPAESN